MNWYVGDLIKYNGISTWYVKQYSVIYKDWLLMHETFKPDGKSFKPDGKLRLDRFLSKDHLIKVL